MEQKHRRKVRETIGRLLGDAGGLLVSDALSGTPAEIEGTGDAIALSIALAITHASEAAANAARKSVLSEHLSNQPANAPGIVWLNAANLARLDGDDPLADLLMQRALRASES
jgi:hypothetical protein